MSESKFNLELRVITNDYELDEGIYANAADYIIHNKSGFGEDYLVLAERLVDKALAMETKGHSSYFIKLRILEVKKEHQEYIRIAKEFINYLETVKPYNGYEESIKELKEDISKA